MGHKNLLDMFQSHKNHLDTVQSHKNPSDMFQSHKKEPDISHNQLRPQPTVARLTEVKLTEDVLTLHHMVKRLTPQLQLTEVKLTEEEPTEVNNTVTRREGQFNYYANLFEDHQTSKKKS